MAHNKKVALVTGGNRGIGCELAKQLALNGFRLSWLVGNKNWVIRLCKNLKR